MGHLLLSWRPSSLPLTTTPSVKRRGPAGVLGAELGTVPHLCFVYRFME